MNKLKIFVGLASLILMGCASSSGPEVKSLVGTQELDGAKFIGGKIWQDQSVNKSKNLNLAQAEEYCKNLTLLGMQGWKLPSIDDVKSMKPQSLKLDHLRHDSYYYTESSECYEKKRSIVDVITLPMEVALKVASAPVMLMLDKETCNYKIDNQKRLRTRIANNSGLVRCVLDPNIYNKKQEERLKYAQSMREKHTYAGYLEAFKISKSIQDIKQSYILAATDSEKLNAERIMVKKLPKKVFMVNSGSGENSNVEADSASNFIVGLSTSSKDVKNNFQVSSSFLEYGSYAVKVKFYLDYTREMRIKMGFLSTTKNQHGQKTVEQVYYLNKTNNYKQNKLITFKDVVSSVNVSGLGGMVDSRSKTKNAKISYEIIGVVNE